jgi:hypothetical protein
MIKLRNSLLKQIPVTRNCSLCGEINIPIENRLCTSVRFGQKIDLIVLISKNYEESQKNFKSALEKFNRNKHINNIFIINENKLRNIPKSNQYELLEISGKHIPAEGYLHEQEDISEHYIVVEEENLKDIDPNPYNFFTSNALPLLLQRESHKTAKDSNFTFSALDSYFLSKELKTEANICPVVNFYGQTKKNNSECKKFYEEFLVDMNHQEYCYAYQQWAYVTRRGIVSTEPHIYRNNGE